MSAYLASLASLCLSLVAKVFALVDDLAMRIPPSCCPICQFNSLRESHLKTRDKNTMLVFNPATEVHSLKKLEDIDGESTVQKNLQNLPLEFPPFSPLIKQSKKQSTPISSPAQPNPPKLNFQENPKSSPQSTSTTTTTTCKAQERKGSSPSPHSSTLSTPCPGELALKRQ